MSAERAERRISINEKRFRGVHEKTVRDLTRYIPDIELLRKRFEEADFDASEAYFIGTWLLHSRADGRTLGLAYLSQAVEFDPTPRHNWALRYESKTPPQISDRVVLIKPEKDFLDHAEIARIREERKRMENKPKKIRRRTRSRRRVII